MPGVCPISRESWPRSLAYYTERRHVNHERQRGVSVCPALSAETAAFSWPGVKASIPSGGRRRNGANPLNNTPFLGKTRFDEITGVRNKDTLEFLVRDCRGDMLPTARLFWNLRERSKSWEAILLRAARNEASSG